MSKLYFFVPNADLAGQIVAELKAHHVSEEDIGVIANDQVAIEALPEGDRSDVTPALKRGAAVGGATGLLAGVAAAIVPGGFAIGGAALAGMALAGGAFGAWVSGLVGASVPNSEIREFESAIEAGSILMIVDTATTDRDQVKRIVADRHREVVFGGEKSSIPPLV